MKKITKNQFSDKITPHFLKIAYDELMTYRTPKKIIDYIESEKIKSIIGNPPYDVCKGVK